MNKNPDKIEDLIANYLAGEATTEEIALVDRWRNEAEVNRRYFDHLKLIFEKAATISTSENFDVDRAWSKLRTKLPDRHQRGNRSPGSTASTYKSFLRMAAAIALFSAVGIFTYNLFRTGPVQTVALLSDTRVKADTLPEGSEVFLNRRTKVEYAFDRRKNVHTATVVGEAYFDINHSGAKTFLVKAEETFIEDIGTSFNVKAYPGSPTIEVVVEEGEVLFYTEGNPGVHLKTNGRGIYNKKTGTFTVADPDPNAVAYKTRSFSFSNHSLEMVVRTLNDVYSTRLEIGENLGSCRLTVSFKDESIDEIAGVIAETFGLTISKSGDVITLKGTGCAKAQP